MCTTTLAWIACHGYLERGFTYGARHAGCTHMSGAAAAACKAACYEPVIRLHTKLSVSVDMRSGTLRGVTLIWVELMCQRQSRVCASLCVYGAKAVVDWEQCAVSLDAGDCFFLSYEIHVCKKGMLVCAFVAPLIASEALQTPEM